VELVYTAFIDDPKVNGQCAGQSGSKACQVEQCELTVPEEISPGDLDIALEHRHMQRLTDALSLLINSQFSKLLSASKLNFYVGYRLSGFGTIVFACERKNGTSLIT
jgi:hypothetical protein